MSNMTTFTKSIHGEDKDQAVESIHVIGYYTNPDDVQSILHFVLYLQLSSDKAVVFNMSPGADLVHGVLLGESVPYATPPNAIFKTTFAVLKTIIVAELLSNITEAKMDRYKFHDGGVGCRWWCMNIISAWEAAGIIGSGSRETLDQDLQNMHVKMPLNVPMPVFKGEFY